MEYLPTSLSATILILPASIQMKTISMELVMPRCSTVEMLYAHSLNLRLERLDKDLEMTMSMSTLQS